MIKKISVIAFMLFCSECIIAQKIILKVFIDNRTASSQNDTIYYDINRPLTWADFKGAPEINHPGGAVTASGFAFDAKMNMTGNTVYLDIRVFTFFSKHNSWKKPNINSDYHLLHEQHHFDITRIYTQKFNDELLKANFTVNNYNKLLSSIFNKIFEENNAFQKKYDDETQHSINTKEQLKWNDEIEKEIKNVTSNQ